MVTNLLWQFFKETAPLLVSTATRTGDTGDNDTAGTTVFFPFLGGRGNTVRNGDFHGVLITLKRIYGIYLDFMRVHGGTIRGWLMAETGEFDEIPPL